MMDDGSVIVGTVVLIGADCIRQQTTINTDASLIEGKIRR